MIERLMRGTSPVVMVLLVAACSDSPGGDDVITAENVGRLERVAAFESPDSYVNAVAFSPDSRRLVSADRNREVVVWERGTWNRQTYQAAEGSLEAADEAGIPFYGTLALSRDGTTIVTTNPDGDIIGRDWEGNELFAFSYRAQVYSTAISPDDRYLAVGGVRDNVVVFDLETLQHVADLPSDREFVTALAFSPDGNTLLGCYERPRNVMATWNTTTWEETSAFSHAEERFDYHDAIFTPDGRQLVLASTRNDLEFLDITSKQVVGVLRGHSSPPFQLAYSPDGTLLASGGNDRTLRLWDAETGEPMRVLELTREPLSVAFSPDGTLLAIGVEREGVQVWAVGR